MIERRSGRGGRIGNLRRHDFQLKTDGGQHLAHSGVQFAAQALPVQFDLAQRRAPAATAGPAATYDIGEVTFNGLESEAMPQKASVHAQQIADLGRLILPFPGGR